MEGTIAARKLHFKEEEKFAKWGCEPCCENKILQVTRKPKTNEVKEGIDCWRAEASGIACELPKAGG